MIPSTNCRGLLRFRDATNADLHILNNAHYNVDTIGFGRANFIRNQFGGSRLERKQPNSEGFVVFLKGNSKLRVFYRLVFITKICRTSYGISCCRSNLRVINLVYIGALL